MDKIIIEQDALGHFINDLRSNAYTSITKVDFAALDQVDVSPAGDHDPKALSLLRPSIRDSYLRHRHCDTLQVSLSQIFFAWDLR